MPAVWCKGISQMFGDVWDIDGWMLRNVSEMADAFGKEILTQNG